MPSFDAFTAVAAAIVDDPEPPLIEPNAMVLIGVSGPVFVVVIPLLWGEGGIAHDKSVDTNS